MRNESWNKWSRAGLDGVKQWSQVSSCALALHYRSLAHHAVLDVQGVASCIHGIQPEGRRTCQQPIAYHEILRCRSSSRLSNRRETLRLVVAHVIGYNCGFGQVGTQ